MRYLICSIERAQKANISLTGRIVCEQGQKVLLNESGVMNCTRLEGTLEQRAEWLEGTVMTDKEAEVYVAEHNLSVKDTV